VKHSDIQMHMGSPVKLKDLNKGDLMIESEYGASIIVILTEDPLQVGETEFEVNSKDVLSGNSVKYRQNTDYLFYGPKIYKYLE